MGIGIGLRQIWRDLTTQKLRTFLTTFGIVWGTVAISLLLAFGQGFHQQLAKSFAGLGEYIVIGFPSKTSIPWEGLGKGRPVLLTEDDIELIRRRAPDLLGASGEFAGSLILNYQDRTLRVDVGGVSPIFGELRNMIAAPGGRWLNELDTRDRRRVLFIGDELAKDIFKADEPVGKTVLLHGSPFLVVGVLKKKDQDSNYNGRDEGKVFVPLTTYAALTGEKYLNNVIFKAVDTSRTEALKSDVIRILAGKHRFSPEDKEALLVWDTTDMYTFLDTFMLGFKLFLGIVGSLTLVVGGIGVSNIMHVVVEERTREIGIKLALGARPRSVLRQFLGETLAITGLGGAVGLAIAAGVCRLWLGTGLQEYVGVPRISATVALASVAMLALVGLLAGYFPAREAARLDPVVAMKV
ncbi:MAG: ABC transporter permease [Acidobacteria bacterium]|nr:ABC transporter permease [Acidobacteriota bacterium]